MTEYGAGGLAQGWGPEADVFLVCGDNEPAIAVEGKSHDFGIIPKRQFEQLARAGVPEAR
jgi:hypothetical protein